MMKKKYDEPPEIPGVNRFSWQISFNKDYANKFSDFLENNFGRNKIVTKNHFEELFYKEFPKKLWKDDLDDVLYTFEVTPHKKLKLYKKDSVIERIKIL